MSDLIDRQAAINRINKQREHLKPEIDGRDAIGDAAYRVCAEFIERLPSAHPLNPCETCLHKGKGWDEDPCDGCTGTESKYEPMVSPDGTLIVNVPKGTKVKRVIVLPYAD